MEIVPSSKILRFLAMDIIVEKKKNYGLARLVVSHSPGFNRIVQTEKILERILFREFALPWDSIEVLVWKSMRS